MKRFPVVPVFLAVVLAALPASAQPEVSGYSGILAEDASFVLEGSGFGNKQHPGPWLWDDFDDGQPGQTIDTTGTPRWQIAGTCVNNMAWWPYYATDNARYAGDQSCKLPFGNVDGGCADPYGGTTDWSHAAIEVMGVPSETIFFQTWYRAREEGPNPVRQCKMWFFSHTDWMDTDTRLECHPMPNERGTTLHVHDCNNTHIYTNYGSFEAINWGESKWTSFEVLHSGGTPGVANGFVKSYHDTELVQNYTGVMRTCSDQPRNEMHLFAYTDADWDAGRPYADGDIMMSEVYIDTTYARVQLGDANVWENCSHREVQIPTAWDDGSITFTVNPGSFADNAPVWLFVFDRKNRVIADPVRLTIGEEYGTVLGPGRPGQPIP